VEGVVTRPTPAGDIERVGGARLAGVFFREAVFFGGESFTVIGYDTNKVAILGTEPKRLVMRETVEDAPHYGTRPGVYHRLHYLAAASREEFIADLEAAGVPTDTV
jgi:hypothetical protein